MRLGNAMDMKSTDQTTPEIQPSSEWYSGTVGDAIDRLDSLIGRIGMNSADQSLAILIGFESIAARLGQVHDVNTLKTLQVQFDGLLARLKNEARLFLRDLGGKSALQMLRAEYQPVGDSVWWNLDDWLAKRQQAQRKRSLLTLGAVGLGLVLLAIVYQRFFAPDPALIARLHHEQNARDALLSGDYESASREVKEGLQYDPQDLDLLTLLGVTMQAAGRQAEAETAYEKASQLAESQEAFLLTRAQAFAEAGMMQDALVDTKSVLAENPQSAMAYMINGQAYEQLEKYDLALDAYNQASEFAAVQDQPELSAIARTRMAFLLQIMSAPDFSAATATP